MTDKLKHVCHLVFRLLWTKICDPLQRSFKSQSLENHPNKDVWKDLFESLPKPDADHLRGPLILSASEVTDYQKSYSAFADLFAEIDSVIQVPAEDVSKLEVCQEIQSRIAADSISSTIQLKTSAGNRVGPPSG